MRARRYIFRQKIKLNDSRNYLLFRSWTNSIEREQLSQSLEMITGFTEESKYRRGESYGLCVNNLTSVLFINLTDGLIKIKNFIDIHNIKNTIWSLPASSAARCQLPLITVSSFSTLKNVCIGHFCQIPFLLNSVCVVKV